MKKFALLVLLLLFPAFAFTQTIGSANVTATGAFTLAAGQTLSLKAQIVGCPSGAVPTYQGNPISNTPNQTASSPFTANGSEVVSFTVPGNDQILCGGQNYTLYAITWLINGFPAAPTKTYRFVDGTTTNLNTATAIGFVPPIINNAIGSQCSAGYVLNGYNADFTPICQALSSAQTVVSTSVATAQSIQSSLTAPSFIGPLTGTASGNLPLSGGTLTGSLNAGIVNGLHNVLPGQTTGDVCGALNALIASFPANTPEVIRIGPGSFTCSAQVTFDPLYISIQGAGSARTSISAAPSGAVFYEYEPTYSIAKAGSLGGFTLNGSATASLIGIRAGSTVGASFDDIVIQNFTGTGSIGLSWDNSVQPTDGWMERTIATNIHLVNNTIGLQLKCNEANSASCSFGYNSMTAFWFTVDTGQIGINLVSGRLYHSFLDANFNSDGSQTAIINVQANAQVDSNFLKLDGESTGSGFVEAAGASWHDNCCAETFLATSGWTNSFPASPNGGSQFSYSASSVASSDFGAGSNWFGASANSYTAWPIEQASANYPNAGFGFFSSSAAAGEYGAYISVPNGISNLGFVVLACPQFSASVTFANCSPLWSVDDSGNTRQLGELFLGSNGIALWDVNGLLQYINPTSEPFAPNVDGTSSLGSATHQWGMVYTAAGLNVAGTPVIQTNAGWVLLSGIAGTGIKISPTGGNTAFLGNTNWNLSAFTINAGNYQVGGVDGFTGTKTAGSCVFTITSGIITNVTGC